MAIDELAQSLLARQDRQREEDWERQRKARKRARREQLLSAAGGIAVNIGNRVLAQKSQDFMDRDILAISAELSYGVGVLMRIRNGHIMGLEKFILKVHDPDSVDKNLSQFILQPIFQASYCICLGHLF